MISQKYNPMNDVFKRLAGSAHSWVGYYHFSSKILDETLRGTCGLAMPRTEHDGRVKYNNLEMVHDYATHRHMTTYSWETPVPGFFLHRELYRRSGAERDFIVDASDMTILVVNHGAMNVGSGDIQNIQILENEKLKDLAFLMSLHGEEFIAASIKNMFIFDADF